MPSSPPPDDLTPPGPPVPPPPPDDGAGGRRAGGDLSSWNTYGHGTPGLDPYARPPADTTPPSKAMAGWSLGLSVAVCVPFGFLIAIGLAIAVLVKSRDGRDHGKGMAIAALVVSAALLVLNVVMAIVLVLEGWDESTRDSDGRVIESGIVTIDRLRVGDCISEYQTTEEVEAGAWATGEVTVVPCDEPHRAEVFAINTVDPTAYVDQQSLDHASSRDCMPGFEEYVGLSYERSVFELMFYNPEIGGDTLLPDEVVCIVSNPEGLRDELMKSSRR